MNRPDLTGPEAYAAGGAHKRETPRGGGRRALMTFSTDQGQQPQITALGRALQEGIAEMNWRAGKTPHRTTSGGGADGQ